MAEWLQIEEPAGARVVPPQWPAFLELGFRPLYLAGCFWAAISVTLWVCAPQWLTGSLAGVAWHAHEMLWGFIATIAVGFLLTASGTWTGINPLRGPALGGLCGVWALARVGYLLPDLIAFWLAAVCELLFFVWAALAIGWVIYKTHNRRNYGVPPLVLALGAADALYLWAAAQGDHALLMQRFSIGLLCMVVIALLVARRVIPFFAMRAITGLSIPMHARSGQWQLVAGGLAIVSGLMNERLAMATALSVAGVITVVHVLTWKLWAVRRVPLLWILYLGYMALGVGLLVAAAHAAGWVSRAAWPVHVIGVAGFSVLIIGMVTRTALGHLGRPLRTDRSMVAAYLLVMAAAVLRLLALLPTDLSLGALYFSAVAWGLAFMLYVWRFFPMMIRPRIDQAAAQATLRPAAPVRAPL